MDSNLKTFAKYFGRIKYFKSDYFAKDFSLKK